MAIDPNKKANGFKHVGCYYTNPWWPTKSGITAKFENNNVVNGMTGETPGSANLMAKWTNGLCVPMFSPHFAGNGTVDKNGDVTYSLTDPITNHSIKFYTDEAAHKYPLIPEYGRGNIWHSALAKPYSLNKYRIRLNSDDGLYPSSDPANFLDKDTYRHGAFRIAAPGSGLDHYTSYYWGGGSKRATTKIKNILGLYWFTATEDGTYYAYINKICLLYQNREGEEVPLIPMGNEGRNDMKKNDYMLNQQQEKEWTPPACGAAWDGQKLNNAKNTNGVLRGAFLDPNQAKYVIENKLELKGMWIEVFRNSGNGTGNPVGIFSSFFPWILSELSLFGRYYLHPFDCMISKVGTDDTGSRDFRDTYYNEQEIAMRDDYFQRYAAEVNAGGGWHSALIDPSGKFSKKILIPPVMPFDRNPQNYSDDFMPLVAAQEQVYGGTTYITSNGL